MANSTRTYPNLETWRKAHGLSQREAALQLEISQTYYSRLERGLQTATRDTAKRIMAETRVPLEVLVGVA